MRDALYVEFSTPQYETQFSVASQGLTLEILVLNFYLFFNLKL